MAKAMRAWMEYMEVVAQERQEEALHELRARLVCMHRHWSSLRDNVKECRSRINAAQKVQTLVRRGCMHHHFTSFRDNAKDCQRRRNVLSRFSLRMRHRKIYTAWASWDAYVKDVRRLQEQLKKMALQRYFQHHLIQFHHETGHEAETSDSLESDSD